jgi:hypothetical protein
MIKVGGQYRSLKKSLANLLRLTSQVNDFTRLVYHPLRRVVAKIRKIGYFRTKMRLLPQLVT